MGLYDIIVSSANNNIQIFTINNINCPATYISMTTIHPFFLSNLCNVNMHLPVSFILLNFLCDEYMSVSLDYTSYVAPIIVLNIS